MTWQHFFHVILMTRPKTWEAIVIIGFPASLLLSLMAYVGYRKMRFYFRTRSVVDGLSGLGFLLVPFSWVYLVISDAILQFFPNTPLETLPIRIVLEIAFFGGLILTIVAPLYKIRSSRCKHASGERSNITIREAE